MSFGESSLFPEFEFEISFEIVFGDYSFIIRRAFNLRIQIKFKIGLVFDLFWLRFCAAMQLSNDPWIISVFSWACCEHWDLVCWCKLEASSINPVWCVSFLSSCYYAEWDHILEASAFLLRYASNLTKISLNSCQLRAWFVCFLMIRVWNYTNSFVDKDPCVPLWYDLSCLWLSSLRFPKDKPKSSTNLSLSLLLSVPHSTV